MQCAECGGEFEKKIITYDQLWGDKEFYLFEGAPALVCSHAAQYIWKAKFLRL